MDEYIYYYNKFTKEYGKNNTCILMQVGSFYEIYSQEDNDEYLDNITNLLEIKKAVKSKKNDNIVFMAGFLCIYVDNYLPKLLQSNYTVIEIQQVGKTVKGVTPNRQVTNIHTPGTYLMDPLSKESNYIVYLYISEQYVRKYNKIITSCGITGIDFSTGSVEVHDVVSSETDPYYAMDEALRCINYFIPKELIICHTRNVSNSKIDEKYITTFFDLENKNYKYYNSYEQQFKKYSYINEFLKTVYKLNVTCMVELFKLEKKPHALLSLVLLLDYISKRDNKLVNNLQNPQTFKNSKHLLLGNDAVKQLNVVKNGDSVTRFNCLAKKKISSLFDLINHTKTPMGQRYLYNLLNNPLVTVTNINESYTQIEKFRKDSLYLRVQEILKCIVDIERLFRKLSLNTIEPYEFYNLYDSINELPNLFMLLTDNKELLPMEDSMNGISSFIKDFLVFFNCTTIKETSKLNFKKSCFNSITVNETVNKTVNEPVNELINDTKEITSIKTNLTKIQVLETKIELENSIVYKICDKLSSYLVNIKNPIQIKCLNKGGYYLLTTKIRADMLKKKLENVKIVNITETFKIDCSKLVYQDSVNSKSTKIFLDELGTTSSNIEQTQDELTELLVSTFKQVCTYFYVKYANSVDDTIKSITKIDNIQSAASVSVKYNYTKPLINDTSYGYIRCKQLRHPIIEAIKTDTEYIPHDISLGHSDNDDLELDGMLIYGLNSAGKSSLMKAIGLSIIMAQCGFYVPASYYEYSPYNSLFARITGNDDLFKGLSSFTLEMSELDSILERTGQKTLVIGDEVCRGTDRVSGIAIVTGTVLKLAETKSSFIFASHLHDVAKMDKIQKLKNVKAFHLTVSYDKKNDILVYDRILREGCGDTVYGCTVAKYIIKNTEFMNTVLSIKSELDGNTILQNKVSKYNNSIYVNQCQVCGFKPSQEHISNHIGLLDTHHINFQKDCENGFVTSKSHLPMNNEANLVVLCKNCHYKVHHDKLVINGYIDTSSGKILDFKML